MKRQLFLLIILITTAWHLFAMPPIYRFKHLTSKDGLPYQQISSILQDANGYIWIGTRNGLSRYDGYEIKTYFHDEKNNNSISGNFIDFLFMDSKKRVWVCSEDAGVSRYDATSDNFHQYPELKGSVGKMLETRQGKIIYGGGPLCVYNEKTDKFTPYPILGPGDILSMALGANDNLYVATNTSIIRYDKSMTKISQVDDYYYKDFLNGANGIVPMLMDSHGKLWIGRNGDGVMYIDLKTGKSTIFKPSQLSNGTVRCINEDRKNNIWLGTEKGITIINPNGKIETIVHDFRKNDGLSDNAIYSIINDANDNIWIGSYFGGVDILFSENNLFCWKEPGYDSDKIKGKVPRAMVETTPGIFWIATEDGGINIYDSFTGKFSVFDKTPLTGTNVHSLYFDRSTFDLWIGTFRKGLFKYNLKTKQFESFNVKGNASFDCVFSFCRQGNGKLWIATTTGLRYYDIEKKQFFKTSNKYLNECFVYCLLTDSKGNVWAGTVHNGLFRIDGRTGEISSWGKGGNNGLEDNYVVSLFQDRNGVIWIGTNSCGLYFFNQKTNRFCSVNDDVLSGNNTICSIIGDKGGKLWISTGHGLYMYSTKSNHTIGFTTGDGLPTNQFNFSSSLLASNGYLLFGTVKGLVYFDPLNVRIKKESLQVHWKKLIIGDTEMNVGVEDSPLITEFNRMEKIRLDYSQARSFCIEYGVINPGNTDYVKYQVKFDGIDKDWRNVGLERRFFGYNLQPGTYMLHVRANSSNTEWDSCPEKVLQITVRPPFYRSTIAYLLYLITILAIFGFALRLVFTREREKNAVRIAQMEKQKIEEIDKEKFDFFTTVSHELKTPLSLIIAPLKNISREELSEHSRKNIDVVVKNTVKMEKLISELVTFNKIETGNFPFYIQKGNPLEFIELGTMQYRETASENNITLKIQCENNGEEVWFSPSYVERILDNLLSNALKFTSEGGTVTVKACITQKPDNNTYLRLAVSDTGIGIAKEEMKNIFTRYYQTKRGYNANNRGWGIGLSLVKRLTDVHKGNITVDSEPNKGSTFTVDLNVSADAFDAKCLINEDKVIVPISQYKYSSSDSIFSSGAKDKKGMAPISDDKLSILIVDDNKDLLDFLYDSYKERYNVYVAENGEMALRLAHEKDIQLVVSDVMMPEMSGIELCSTLKNDVATSHIPVILLTAKSESDDVVEGYKSGAEAYVSKPFDPQILELQIKNIISLQKTRQNEVAVTDDSNIDVTSLNDIDKELMHKLNVLIDENIGNSDFSISDVTQALAISRSLLYTKMKNLVNMSTGDYIRKKRLERACEMLRKGCNVSMTAYGTGFADPNYFSKAFKKYFGISPTEYIDKNKNNTI